MYLEAEGRKEPTRGRRLLDLWCTSGSAASWAHRQEPVSNSRTRLPRVCPRARKRSLFQLARIMTGRYARDLPDHLSHQRGQAHRRDPFHPAPARRIPRLTSVGVLAESSRVRSCRLSCMDEIIGRHRIATHRCQSERGVVGIPPGFRSELFQFERFRLEHRDLAVAARTLRPDVAVVATLADSGRAVLVPPRGSLLADATLPLPALAHLGESPSRAPSPARSATMDG